MRAFITGSAGFIGSHLTDRLLCDGYEVIGYDNQSTGKIDFLKQAFKCKRFQLIKGDLLDQSALCEAMGGCDVVFHLAANADVRFGLQHPDKDLNQNTIGTFNILESMRKASVAKIAFSSTGSVYGDSSVIPTPEVAPFPIQTSLYGASKLAGEALIQAYAEGFGIKAWIFRFVGVLGERYSHGHVIDFCRQLLVNPNKLTVLGNGQQRKSYIYVRDCVEGMVHAMRVTDDKVNIFNLGTDHFCTLNDCIRWICEELSVDPEVSYGTEERGWIGDNPFIFLDTSRICALGWAASLTIEQSIKSTVRYLRDESKLSS